MDEPKVTCEHCNGYGWWPFGAIAPLGQIDADEWRGYRVKCPTCGAGDEAESERYKELLAKLPGPQKGDS